MQRDKFRVGVLGLKKTEKGLLKTLFGLNSGRAWLYELDEDLAVGSKSADIWVVDRDNPASLDSWRRIAASASTSPCVSVYSSQETSGGATDEYTFFRPLRMSHLIKALDEIVVKRLHYVPPIGDNTAVDRKLIPAFASGTGSQVAATGIRALVVDDSPTIRTLMAALLRGLGIEVDLAEESAGALFRLRGNHYDIIFLDVVMPGNMDGYKLCKTIKADERCRGTPVVMLTSKDTMIDKVRGKLSGADAYLTKPVDQRELIAFLGKIFQA